MTHIPIKLDGKMLAQHLAQNLAERVRTALATAMRPPTLAVIQVGHDKASSLYIQRKQQACQHVGIDTRYIKLDADCDEGSLLEHIEALNANASVDGILLQLPLPVHIHKGKMLDAISIDKDADGLHPYHLGLLAQGRPTIRACTPFGIMRLLEHYQCPIAGVNALVIGRSPIVGRPMLLELCNAGATVTIAHSQSRDLASLVAQADLLVCATGVMDVIDSHWIKEGATVVDVGIHRLQDDGIRGDLDGSIVAERAAFYTPVPGGVGPMTVMSLLENTWTLYTHRI